MKMSPDDWHILENLGWPGERNLTPGVDVLGSRFPFKDAAGKPLGDNATIYLTPLRFLSVLIPKNSQEEALFLSLAQKIMDASASSASVAGCVMVPVKNKSFVMAEFFIDQWLRLEKDPLKYFWLNDLNISDIQSLINQWGTEKSAKLLSEQELQQALLCSFVLKDNTGTSLHYIINLLLSHGLTLVESGSDLSLFNLEGETVFDFKEYSSIPLARWILDKYRFKRDREKLEEALPKAVDVIPFKRKNL